MRSGGLNLTETMTVWVWGKGKERVVGFHIQAYPKYIYRINSNELCYAEWLKYTRFPGMFVGVLLQSIHMYMFIFYIFSNHHFNLAIDKIWVKLCDVVSIQSILLVLCAVGLYRYFVTFYNGRVSPVHCPVCILHSSPHIPRPSPPVYTSPRARTRTRTRTRTRITYVLT